MSAQHHFAPGDHLDRDLYARERVLNSTIIAARTGRRPLDMAVRLSQGRVLPQIERMEPRLNGVR